MKHIVMGEIDDSKRFSTNHILFMFDNTFYLVTYHNMYYTTQHDFVVDVLTNHIKDSKVKNYSFYNVSKSNTLQDDFNNKYFDFDKITKKAYHEINYIYCDNAGKCYCVSTKMPYKRKNMEYEKLSESYYKLREFTKKYNLLYIEDQAIDLYRANVVYPMDTAKYISRTEDLIKLINTIQ